MCFGIACAMIIVFSTLRGCSMFKRDKHHFFLASSTLLLVAFFSFIPNPSAALKPIDQPIDKLRLKSYSLTETIAQNLTSLHFQPLPEQNSLLDNARFYARIRHGLISLKLKQKFQQDCLNTGEKNPFCAVLQDHERDTRPPFLPRVLPTVKVLNYNQREVNSWVAQANLRLLTKVKESTLRQALKEFTTYPSLEKLSSALITHASCNTAALSLLLGNKIEEFLPDATVRQQAIQLYESVMPCEMGDRTLRARFRLSLLYIWEGRCQAASPHLEQLAELPNHDYRSRALFWQIECAKQMSEPAAVAQAKQTLSVNYPFSLHTLLARNENAGRGVPLTLKEDSEIRFRVANNEQLNRKMSAVEALMKIQELSLAREILEKIDQILVKSDPQVRLYAGVLYSRLNCYIRNFRLLTSAFKDDPKLISKASLELFYPESPIPAFDLNHFESSVDRKLLLSLMRQESAFNSLAHSSAGALGLMQIMPGTARLFGRMKQKEKLYDPNFNLKIGSLYFSTLLKRYDSDAELALAAYNAGPNRVDAWLKRYPVRNRILFLDLIPFKETREYVAAIARNYFWYTALYADSQLKSGTIKLGGKVAHRSFEKVFRLLGT
jgi:tetratricopeptide (TPR) repeat protein